MKKFEILGRKLSKEEQRKISGGLVDPGGGGCFYCECLDNGYGGCWYTNNPYTLCPRVYPNCSHIHGWAVSCDGCVMN